MLGREWHCVHCHCTLPRAQGCSSFMLIAHAGFFCCTEGICCVLPAGALVARTLEPALHARCCRIVVRFSSLAQIMCSGILMMTWMGCTGFLFSNTRTFSHLELAEFGDWSALVCQAFFALPFLHCLVHMSGCLFLRIQNAIIMSINSEVES